MRKYKVVEYGPFGWAIMYKLGLLGKYEYVIVTERSVLSSVERVYQFNSRDKAVNFINENTGVKNDSIY